MKLFICLFLICSFNAIAEDEAECRENIKNPTPASRAAYRDCLARNGLNTDVAECRRKMHTQRSRMYIEEVERCQSLLLRESIENFNNFADRREPVTDCAEARDHVSLVNTCRRVGVNKVKEQGRAWGFNLRDQDVYACDVDSGWVSSYVWFCANTPRGEIRKLTQKPIFQDCF